MDQNARHLVNNLWWVSLVKGLAAIAFGIAAIFWTGITLVALVYIFSAYILISGILNVIYGIISAGRTAMWLLILLLGALEVGIGVYAVRNPFITLGAFLLLAGFTFVFRGVLEIVTAFMEDAPDGTSRSLLIITGTLSLIAGLFILLQPVVGGLAFVWALGVYALITGPVHIARAASSRSLANHQSAPAPSELEPEPKPAPNLNRA